MNWEHFQALLWLRWRLTRNRVIRAGSFNAVLSLILIGFVLLGGVAAGITGALVGALVLGGAKPHVLLLVWDGVLCAFLFVWLVGLMVEIQRSETIDLSKLLHLPVTLQQVFVLNYAASHLTPSVVLFLPAVLGLCAGLTIGAGFRMALVLPLALSFFFMLTAWTYCLRGRLTALMVNKRRRRAVIVWITLVMVLVSQLPNLVLNSRFFRHAASPGTAVSLPASGHTRKTSKATAASPVTPEQPDDLALPPAFVLGHLAVPPGWVGYSAMALRQHQPWPAIGGIAVSCLIGALGLLRAYRLTLRFYQGAEGGAESRPVVRPATAVRARGPLLVERRLPWLPDDTAGLALATFRSLLRSPELKMALIMPIVIGAVLGSLHFTRPKEAPPAYLTALAGTAVAALAAFSVANIMSNVFGLDRNGFRALVLLPTRRHHILLAKNVAFFPLVSAVAFVLLLLAKFLLPMSWTGFLAGLLQIPMAFMLFCLPCNLVSILVPYRVAIGTLQAKKVKPSVLLGVLITLVSLPLIMLPMLVAPGLQLLFSFMAWTPWLPVNLLASIVMLAAVASVYWLLLPLEGRLLHKREQLILREVTEELE
jgi:ABC-2 type transport system permease protein